MPGSPELETWHAAGRALLAKALAELAYEEILQPRLDGAAHRVELSDSVDYRFRARRGPFGTALLASLSLGACGDDDKATSAASEPESTRTVRHAMGTATISGTPRRVVVLDTGELDSAVALGVKPVGAVEAIAGEGLPAYLGDAAEGIELVGTIEQPSVEAIAALRPDLILSSKVRHEAIYDQLARVAPTVFSEEVGVTWKENFALHAEALGRGDEASRLQAEYDEKARALGAALGGKRAGSAVSVVRSVGDEVRIYLKANFLGTILADAGLPRPKAQDKDEFSETATPERIPDLDGDLMILSRFGDDHRLLKRLQDSRLWSRLDVVKATASTRCPTTCGSSGSATSRRARCSTTCARS